MANRRAHVFVEGRVQGVFFRAETKKIAEDYGLTGWVRNLPDGRVEAVFEGSEAAVGRAVLWCREGPAFATVTGLELKDEPFSGAFDTFFITC